MPNLKEQEIFSVATVEKKILPIISLKKEPLKQNILKDIIGDSLSSSTIVINDSDDNNDNTILLLVPIAS